MTDANKPAIIFTNKISYYRKRAGANAIRFDYYNFYVTLDGERLTGIPRWRMQCPYN